MPGAWEIREANQMLVGILHTDLTSIAWSFGLRNLIIPGRNDLRSFYPFMPVAGMPFDHARNAVVQRAIQMGVEWIAFLDSDVVPPHDAFVRLLAHKYPLISGMYCRRSPPHAVPVMIRNGQWVTQFRPGETIEVDYVGAGCLLTHRSLYERLPPQRPQAGRPWYDWRVDCQGVLPPGECLSEDFTFCQAVKRHLGISVRVDTSIACKHVGLAEATYGDFRPLDCAPLT